MEQRALARPLLADPTTEGLGIDRHTPGACLPGLWRPDAHVPWLTSLAAALASGRYKTSPQRL